MAAIANTGVTPGGAGGAGTSAVGDREQLLNVIYNIAPGETPLLTNAGKLSLTREVYDWQTDTLRAPAANAQLEGDDSPAFPAFVPTLRLRNSTQISRELVLVSATQDVVNKAGRGEELAYKIAQGSLALKRDLELASLANVIPKNTESGATARKTGGLPVWIATNTDKGTGPAADPIYTTVSGITAPTTAVVDGTERAYTEAQLRNVLQKIYTAGGNPSTVMLGPATKQTMSQFGGIATKTFYQDSAQPSVIISAADVYVGDYGKLSVIPNRFMRLSSVGSNISDVFVIDWDLIAVGYLRPFMALELAKTGDAEKRMLIVEWGIMVKNEVGLGIVRDVNN